jgi:5-methylthioadenosine/S-adenosylhomocysteine deaminase
MGALAAEKSGVNMALLGADMDLKQNAGAVIKKIESDYNKYNGKNGNVRYIPGCHSVYTCSRQLLEAVADFAAEKKSPTYIHLSETLKEVGDSAEKNNDLTPPQLLRKIGYFDYGGIAAHCVYVDKDDIRLLKQSGVSAAVCSGSNLKLASGLPPVYSMLQGGMNVTLGSDGPASNNRLDIFREMYLAAALPKGALNIPTAVTPCQALKMATVNAAKALKTEKGGVIKAGYAADLIRVSTDAPHFQPRADIMASLVYCAQSSDVVMTMCGGKILYSGGQYYIGEDIEDIYRECGQRAQRLISSI